MNEWTNEQMNKWTNEQMNKWINEKMNKKNKWIKEYLTIEHMNIFANE